MTAAYEKRTIKFHRVPVLRFFNPYMGDEIGNLTMADIETLKLKIRELAERDWDVPALEARIKKLAEEDIPRKTLNRDEMLANKQQIRDRVQQRAEEYNFITKKCGLVTGIGASLAAGFMIDSTK